MMPDHRSGKYVSSSVAGEECRAFIPPPLPPDPPLSLTADDYDLMEKANRALGRLDGVATLLPDTSLFIYFFFVRKEAVLSSQIEGTQSSIADLLLYENAETPGTPLEDVEEVSSYVAALRFGLQRLNEGLPLSLRLLREVHQVLLSTGRGSSKLPGEFRRSQNWIGGTRPGSARFVPPPPEKLMERLFSLPGNPI
jgi:Fic family protein